MSDPRLRRRLLFSALGLLAAAFSCRAPLQRPIDVAATSCHVDFRASSRNLDCGLAVREESSPLPGASETRSTSPRAPAERRQTRARTASVTLTGTVHPGAASTSLT
jgi:hypothetical protein